MLVGSFAFANNSNLVSSVSKEEAIDLIKSSTNYETAKTDSLVDCLLTITFIYTDGSRETIKVLVKGTTCAELLSAE